MAESSRKPNIPLGACGETPRYGEGRSASAWKLSIRHANSSRSLLTPRVGLCYLASAQRLSICHFVCLPRAKERLRKKRAPTKGSLQDRRSSTWCHTSRHSTPVCARSLTVGPRLQPCGNAGWGSIPVVFPPVIHYDRSLVSHHTTCDILFPPRSGGIYWKGMISAVPLCQWVWSGDHWDPVTSARKDAQTRPTGRSVFKERLGEWDGQTDV